MIFNLLYAESKISHLTNHPENCTIAPFINSSFLFFHRPALQPWSNINKGAVIPRFECSITVGPNRAALENQFEKVEEIFASLEYTCSFSARRCVESQKIGEILLSYFILKMNKYKYRRENCIEIVVKLRSTWLKFFLEFCFMRTSVNIEEENSKSRIFSTSLWIFETSMYRRLVARLSWILNFYAQCFVSTFFILAVLKLELAMCVCVYQS